MKILKVTLKKFYGDYKAKKKNVFSNIQVGDFMKCLLFEYLFEIISRDEKDNL